MSSNANVQIVVTLQDRGSRNLLQQLGLVDGATGRVNAGALQAGGALNRMAQTGAQGLHGVNASARAAAASVQGIGNAARQSGSQLGGMRVPLAAVDAQVRGIGERIRGWGSMGAQAVAGWGAAKAVGGAMIEKPLDYDARAQDLANTAAHDKDAAGKVAEKTNIKAAVEAAVKQSGGTQDGGLALLGKMIGGGMDKDKAMAALPAMVKAQVASRMDGETLGDLVNVMGNAGIDPSRFEAMLSKGIKTGQMGSFEFDAMGKNGLSSMVMANKNMGMTGEQAMTTAMIDLQMNKKMTGSDADAATNYRNFQAKITSADTQARLKKDFNVDTNAELQKGAVHGKGAMETFMGIADKIATKEGKGAEFRALVAELQAMQKNGASQADVAQKMSAITALDRTGIFAQILPDMQAGMAMAAKDLFAKDGKNIQAEVDRDNGQALQGNWAANDSTAQASVERNRAASDASKQRALDAGGDEAIKMVNDGLAGLKTEFPMLSAALEASTVAVGMLTAAVGGSMLAGALTNGGLLRRGGAAPGSPSFVGPPAPAGANASGLRRLGGGVLGLAAVAAVPVLQSAAGEGSAVARYGSAAISGASTGALVASIVPGVGTAVGAAVGGVLGLSVAAFNDWRRAAQTPAAPPAAAPAMRTQAVNAGADPSRPPVSMLNPQSIMLASPPRTTEPSGQGLIQANAQLQQVNQQITTLNQVANNERLLAPLGQIQSGIAALNGKNYTVTATIPVYIDGSMVSQRVNTINAIDSYRGAR